MAWNVLSLFTTSGMLFLEVSLLAFLLQGNYASGLEALTQTFVLSGILVGLDLLLKAIYMFGFGIPLFVDQDDHTHRMGWNLLSVHRLVLMAAYGLILFMYHSKWRESKTFILQIYSYHVSDKCTSNVCFWTYRKLSLFWVLVIRRHYCLLPCLLSSSSICNIYGRLLPRHHPSSIAKCSLTFLDSPL